MSELNFTHSNGNKVKLTTPDTLAANKTFKLPGADGSSGQFLKTDGSGAFSFDNANITEVDSWRITSNFTSPSSWGNFITANWARKSTSLNFAKKGVGMTESSGVFTFPSTGLWLVQVSLSGNTNGNNLTYWGPYINVSSNSGASYDRRSETYGHMDHGTRYMTITGHAYISVTDASTFRVKLETENSATLNIRASNNMSNLDFIRLGDF